MSALSDLSSALDSVRELLKLESAYSDPPDDEERAAAFGLRGAATVLTVACFEAFLRSCFEEQLDRIVNTQVPLTSYTAELHASAIFASLELAMKGDHETRGSVRKDRISAVVSAAKLVASGTFNPRALSATESNPNSECVRRMFKAVGKQDIFRSILADFEKKWGSAVSMTFCADKLNGLVGSRHKVAHSAVSSHVARSELPENVRFIEVLGAVLCSALSDHVEELIAGATSGIK